MWFGILIPRRSLVTASLFCLWILVLDLRIGEDGSERLKRKWGGRAEWEGSRDKEEKVRYALWHDLFWVVVFEKELLYIYCRMDGCLAHRFLHRRSRPDMDALGSVWSIWICANSSLLSYSHHSKGKFSRWDEGVCIKRKSFKAYVVIGIFWYCLLFDMLLAMLDIMWYINSELEQEHSFSLARFVVRRFGYVRSTPTSTSLIHRDYKRIYLWCLPFLLRLRVLTSRLLVIWECQVVCIHAYKEERFYWGNVNSTFRPEADSIRSSYHYCSCSSISIAGHVTFLSIVY